MSTNNDTLAWLEQPSGGRVPIQGTCSIGRRSTNNVVIRDDRVSRRHALVNAQGHEEFWLVDLGSGNGTYLNGRRVAQPTRLRDGDRIEIAEFHLVFHETQQIVAPSIPDDPDTAIEEKTLQQIKSADCWLLVSDIEDSTLLVRKVSGSDLPAITGPWLGDCKQLVESCGGSLNKFLGDGFFAYWPQRSRTEEQVARALEKLLQMQRGGGLTFRVVLHFGQVSMGGGGSLGEESLHGKEVHFVFRMEKLAGAIGERCLVSSAAKARLPASLKFGAAKRHPLAGFEGEHSFYPLRG